MLEYWIWLSGRTAISDKGKLELILHFGTAEDVYLAEEADLKCVEGMTQEGLEALADKSLDEARSIQDKCDRSGIRLLTYCDSDYPERLKNIYDPPILLYYKGTLPAFDELPAIGVVGTRKASAYGLTVARRMGYEISRCGGLVVSGLADGADGAAMGGALTAGSCVAGVLGCGIDVVYPKSNRFLYRDTERYGCILSEYPPETPPLKWHFPRRNRIISGLCVGVVVTEAPMRSGSLITARDANEQGRDVFAVPGNIDMPTFAGSNHLLREGAIPVCSGWDVVSEYQSRFPDKIHRDEAPMPEEAAAKAAVEAEPVPAKVAQKSHTPRKKQGDKPAIQEKNIDIAAASPYIDLSGKGLSADELRICEAIGQGETLVDDVIHASGLSAGKVLCLLTMLEIRHIVYRRPGKRVSLKP